MIELPSPNHGPRPDGASVSVLVLHYTGMPNAAAALERLCAAGSNVSAHYTIDEDGTIYRHVAEDLRAWHAGVARWRDWTDLNSVSIGVELVNPGHEFGYRPFPDVQMAALETLAADILRRHAQIIPANVVGHADIAWRRKQDPGELFDWPRLAAAGIGLWPEPGPGDFAAAASGTETMDLLREYGYDIGDGEAEDLRQVVIAFQRHFRPGRLSGDMDGETLARLRALVRRGAA